MEWLENSSELQVPSLKSLLSQPFAKMMKLNIVEEIYDYWLEKRLSSKQRLLHRVKKESKRKRTKMQKADDPYVAFRQCQEKMHTRKNRAADHENYVKMLRQRREINQYLKYALRSKQMESRKHQAVKMKLAMFEDQYRNRNFIEPHLIPVKFFENETNFQGEILGHQESDTESDEEMYEDVYAMGDFTFNRRNDCQFYLVRNSNKFIENFNIFQYF